MAPLAKAGKLRDNRRTGDAMTVIDGKVVYCFGSREKPRRRGFQSELCRVGKIGGVIYKRNSAAVAPDYYIGSSSIHSSN